MLVSNCACVLVEIACLSVLILRAFDKNRREKRRSWIPLYIWIISPYVYSCSVKQFIESGNDANILNLQDMIGQGLVYTSMTTWFYIMSLMVVFGLIHTFIGLLVNLNYIMGFWRLNFNRRTGGRKTIRILDTLASMLTLIGLIIGMTSIFIDQYDIEIDPEGLAKEVVDKVETFRKAVHPLQIEIKKQLANIDKHYTCERIYQVLGTGATLTLFASFFPGASSLVSLGSRSAYYGVRMANALTNLAKRLKSSAGAIWRVSLMGIKLTNFATKNLKKLIVATNSVDIGRILPLLPPVIFGVYVLFGVFWPSRLVFFSAKQRRNHMSDASGLGL